MGRDKGYGSGKPLTANASRSRARVAAGRFTKGKKRAVDNLVISKKGGVNDTLKKIAAKNPPTGFVGGGFLAAGRAAQIAAKLISTGQAGKAALVTSRSAAAEAGRTSSRLFAEATAKSSSLGNKRFQKLAQEAWDQKWLGENIRSTSRTLPRKASLAVPPTIGKKLAKANRANTVVRGAESAFNNALKAGRGKSFGVLENIETAASRLQGLRSRGVPKRGR